MRIVVERAAAVIQVAARVVAMRAVEGTVVAERVA